MGRAVELCALSATRRSLLYAHAIALPPPIGNNHRRGRGRVWEFVMMYRSLAVAVLTLAGVGVRSSSRSPPLRRSFQVDPAEHAVPTHHGYEPTREPRLAQTVFIA